MMKSKVNWGNIIVIQGFYIVLSCLDITVGFAQQTLELSEDTPSVSVCVSLKEGDIKESLSLEIDPVRGSAGNDGLYILLL